MFKRILVAVALACGLVSGAVAADGSTWGTVRGWTIGIDPSVGYGCFIYAAFEDNAYFRLGFNPSEDNAYVVFGDDDWQSIEADKTYPLTMQMGRKGKWTGEATGGRLDGVPVLVVTATDAKFIYEIAAQSYARAWFGSKQIANISLKGTAAAIREMIDCQDAMNREHGGNAVPSDPFAGGSSDDPFSK